MRNYLVSQNIFLKKRVGKFESGNCRAVGCRCAITPTSRLCAGVELVLCAISDVSLPCHTFAKADVSGSLLFNSSQSESL